MLSKQRHKGLISVSIHHSTLDNAKNQWGRPANTQFQKNELGSFFNYTPYFSIFEGQ